MLAFTSLLLSLTRLRAVCSSDSLGWKLFYVTGCLFVAVQNLEDWEVRPARVRVGGCNGNHSRRRGFGASHTPHSETLA